MKIDLKQGDCLELMKEIPDESIDMILCDPPYGTIKNLKIDGWRSTTTKWDNRLPTEEMFKEYERILRQNGALLLFSQEPYTSQLRTINYSNLPFSYGMIWEKDNWGNPLLAKKKPLNVYEDISLFFKKYDRRTNTPLRKYAQEVFIYLKCNYQIKSVSQLNKLMHNRKAEHFFCFNTMEFSLPTKETYQELMNKFDLEKNKWFLNYQSLKKMNAKRTRVFNISQPIKNVFHISKESTRYHPTQKPIALLKKLIKMYTNENDTVLDNCMGSGSTGVACVNTNRNFIGYELDQHYFEVAKKRIDEALHKVSC